MWCNICGIWSVYHTNFGVIVAWGLAHDVYLMVLTTQPSLEDYNMVYSVHACAARYNS